MQARTSYASMFAVGAVAGLLLFGLVRLAFAPLESVTHYHANFAIFIDGERVDLSDDRYMEDVVSCRLDPEHVEPEDRVHLHNNDPGVVHVHDRGATWAHFLANLNFGLGPDYLVTDRGERHFTQPGRTLKVVLNDSVTHSIQNVVIRPNDRLLISVGPETVDQVVRTQFATVASDAAEFSRKPDPASCAGAAEPGFGDRLRRAFWF